jgi:hypothetical protein
MDWWYGMVFEKRKNRKIVGTYTLDIDVVDFLDKQKNKSEYINLLILREMETMKKSIDLDSEIQKADEARQKQIAKDQLLRESQAAYNSLTPEVRAKVMEVGMAYWLDQWLPIYKLKGTLDVEDIVLKTKVV